MRSLRPAEFGGWLIVREDILALLGDATSIARQPELRVEPASDAESLRAYHALRHRIFVGEQGLFDGHDLDDRDVDPRTVVLIARSSTDGAVLGGVRLGPASDDPDIGWWLGGRLVTAPGAGRGVGRALVRAAVAHAEAAGVLRFEAAVQARHEGFFEHLGWERVHPLEQAHVLMRWPFDRITRLVASTKNELGALLSGWTGVGGYLGDDGVPVPGSDLVAACDAILPSMVERDPEWAGWSSVLVNLNDLAAMGATPSGLLDAVSGRDGSFVSRVLAGLRAAADAFDVPVLGGHTQFEAPASLAVTALGRTTDPVPGGGGRAGQQITASIDLSGQWRQGYHGRQWDSTSGRRTPELRAMLSAVGRARPAAAKDISMAGTVGSLGMLAEASGCGAVLDVASVPRPAGVATGDWLTCFPGFGVLTAEDTDAGPPPAAPATSSRCGELVAGSGVALRWPDGVTTRAIPTAVTGWGPA